MRIPFDSICLNRIVAEIEPFVGGKVQGVRGPDESTLALELYGIHGEGCLLICTDPLFARVHFVTRRPGNPPQPLRFCAAVRNRCMGAKLMSVRQVAADRVMEICFTGDSGDHRLVVELMGKHSNMFLVDSEGMIVSAAKWVAPGQSRRVIQPGTRYEWPPVIDPANTLLSSPFFSKLVASLEDELTAEPTLVVGSGAYPYRVGSLGLPETPKATLSLALEAHYDRAVLEEATESLRSSLLGQLSRVILAREVAIGDLERLEAAGDRAGEHQKSAELILAYGAHLPIGHSSLDVWDYDGNPISLKLNPELTGKENALRLFEKAKRAKARSGWVKDQLPRMKADLERIRSFSQSVQDVVRLKDLEALRDEARKNRWLHTQLASGKAKEDRPFEGHRIRQLVGPGNCAILFGENAESNDYLTNRVAKSNDWWLHLRGGTSAHVVILSHNQPDRINREQLLYAAKIVVQNSPSKHAGFVAVDYTLKKYVRKPRGAPKGTALYSNEKTLHIES